MLKFRTLWHLWTVMVAKIDHAMALPAYTVDVTKEESEHQIISAVSAEVNEIVERPKGRANFFFCNIAFAWLLCLVSQKTYWSLDVDDNLFQELIFTNKRQYNASEGKH
jgi:hypothetical protein